MAGAREDPGMGATVPPVTGVSIAATLAQGIEGACRGASSGINRQERRDAGGPTTLDKVYFRGRNRIENRKSGRNSLICTLRMGG